MILQRIPDEADRSLFELLQSLYSHTTTALAETPDDIFELDIGVRQGGPESPLLYNLFMDYVMRVFLHASSTAGIRFLKLKYLIPSEASQTNRTTIGYHTMDWIGYADDLVLMFESCSDLQKALDLLDKTFTRFELEINISKTKTMILNHDCLQTAYPASIVHLKGSDIGNVEVFIYLGCKIKYDEPLTGNAELELRIDLGESKFYELGKNLMNYKIRLSTRVKILNALVRSRLTYSCQTWGTTKVQIQRLSSVYCSMLRKMIKGGYRRKHDSWSYVLSNQDILNISNTEDILQFVARQQRNYAAHVIRKDNNSIAKMTMFNGDHRTKRGRKITLLQSACDEAKCSMTEFYKNSMNRIY